MALGALWGLAVLPAYLWLRWQEQGTCLGEAGWRFWIVSIWGTAWVLVQQEESVGARRCSLVFVGFTEVCVGLEGIAGSLCSENFGLTKPHPDRI